MVTNQTNRMIIRAFTLALFGGILSFYASCKMKPTGKERWKIEKNS